MNFLDIILIVLLGLAFIHGFRKGLIIELATLAALVIGTWAGFYFSDWLSGIIERGFDYHGKYINIISFIIIFIVVIVLMQLLARLLTKVVKLAALGLLNRITGGIFSLLKAAVILSVLIYFMNRFDEDRSFIKVETRQNSLLFPIIEGIAPVFMPRMKEYTGMVTDWQNDDEDSD
jgi:membrane protein required for colicin V production